MRLPCPFCGLRDAAEFSYEGPAARRPALDAPTEAWVEAVYLRDQPRGPAEELWRHAYGCRSLIVMERDVVTHEVHGARLAHPGMQAALSDAEAEGEAEPTAEGARAPARRRAEDAAGGGGGGGA
jgi:sarcosine oxidase subunit delta